MNTAVRAVFAAISALAALSGVAASLRLNAAAARAIEASDLFEAATSNAGISAPELSGASRLARLSIEACPSDPEPHYLLGRIASREGRHADAASHLSDSLRIDPFDANIHYYLARALGETGRRAEETREIEIAADLGRNHPPLLYWCGYLHWAAWKKNGRMLDLSKAFEYFRKAAEGDLSYLDHSLKTVESFSLHYDNVVKLIPDDPRAHHKAARYLGYNRGLWTPALAEFEKAGIALESDPNFMYDRGIAKLFTGGDMGPDLLAGLKRPDTRHAWTRRLVFFFQAAQRVPDASAFWDALEREYPDLSAAAVNRVEMEMIIARDSLAEFKKKAFAELEERKRTAATPEEKRSIEKYYSDKVQAEYAARITPTEGYLRDRIRKFGDGELLGLLGDMLEAQNRPDEAETALRSGARAGNTPLLWKKYVEFLLRKPDFDAAWKAALEASSMFPTDEVFAKLAKIAQDRMLGEKR